MSAGGTKAFGFGGKGTPSKVNLPLFAKRFLAAESIKLPQNGLCAKLIVSHDNVLYQQTLSKF